MFKNNKSGLWLDYDIKNEIDDKNLIQFKSEGYIILKQIINHNTIDELLNEFYDKVKNYENSSSFKDKNGFYSRLCNFHMDSEIALKIAFNDLLIETLKKIFNGEPILFSSLFFEKGSEQRIHRDTPYFYTYPKNLFVGVWVALEDIQEGTGELLYYPKGHLFDIDIKNLKRKYNDLNWDTYNKEVQHLCEFNKLELVKFLPKKGDVLIWHPELPHGGSKRIHENLSRKSIVFHFKKINVPIYGTNIFFKQKIFKTFYREKKLKFGNNFYIDQYKPIFAPNEY